MKFSNLLVFVILSISVSSVYGQWNSNTAINTSVCVAVKTQQNTHSVPDKKNGVIIGWDDNRNNTTGSTDIYTQRLNSDGIAKWTTNGVVVCADTNTQRSVAIVEDGNGGVILTWEDNRSGNYDIYAQKVDSNGVPQWTTNGVVITNGLNNQKRPQIVNDNAGGAIIVWEDSVNSYFDIYAQRINTAGTVVWTTNGIPICTALNNQNNPRLDFDGLGGAIITWQDRRNSVDYDIYAQRVDGAGTQLWTIDGIVVCNAANTQSNPRIEPDGSNGAIIAWTDKRTSIDYDIYAQRLSSVGGNLWTANGIAVCNSFYNQSALDMKYLGSNGVAISWKDLRNASTFDIYAQIISLAGTNVMAANGVKISNGLKSLNPNNITDGSGGVIIAWEDSSAIGKDIKSQKINSAGVLQWSTGGVVVSNPLDDQINVTQVSDGNGGAIFVWDDHRNTTDYDIFAQHLYYDGNSVIGIRDLLGNISSGAIFYPNPACNSATLKLSDKQLADFKISIYNSFGELVMEEERQNTNSFNLQFNGFNAGIYHYTIFAKEKNTTFTGTFILEK